MSRGLVGEDELRDSGVRDDGGGVRAEEEERSSTWGLFETNEGLNENNRIVTINRDLIFGGICN